MLPVGMCFLLKIAPTASQNQAAHRQGLREKLVWNVSTSSGGACGIGWNLIAAMGISGGADLPMEPLRNYFDTTHRIDS